MWEFHPQRERESEREREGERQHKERTVGFKCCPIMSHLPFYL
jgi:hypothetical protein